MSEHVKIKLIVGLGNHTQKYLNTRHNAGFWWLDALWKQQNCTPKLLNNFNGMYALVVVNTHHIHTLQPTTYMNDSGIAVQKIMHFYKLTASEILIVHDELDLLPGKIRLKYSGGHAGHNGIRSIMQHLNTPDFLRIRVGIGHPGREQVLAHVLSDPQTTERHLITSAIQFSLQQVPDIIGGNWQNLFGLFNSFIAAGE